MSRVTPYVWFDGHAEEAARFYVSLLPDSRIDKLVRAAADTPGKIRRERSGRPNRCCR